MNRTIAYDAGPGGQLAHWMAAGMLDAVPANAPHVANAYDPAAPRWTNARAPICDVNCAHCHNPQGPAHTSGLDLRFDA